MDQDSAFMSSLMTYLFHKFNIKIRTELKLNPSNENYPCDAMHVYAQNDHCDEWNT